MEKTFLLGVGAQKSGTTWLQAALSRQPWADFGRIKEYHVLTPMELSESKSLRREQLQRVRWLSGKNDISLIEGRAYVWMQMAFFAEPELYYAYLQTRVNPDRGVYLTGDITPAYCSLPVEDLRTVRARWRELGFAFRVCFLMRDPVERAWSAVKHTRRRQKRQNPDLVFEQTMSETLRDRYMTDGFRRRGDYAETISRLREALHEEEVFFGLYETLFTQSEIDRLSGWLGAPRMAPDFETRLNVSTTDESIEDDLSKEIANFFAPSYRAAEDVFGKDVIARHWRSAALLD